MKSLNPNAENNLRNGVIGMGLVPDRKPANINVKVSRGIHQYDVAVPPNSSFSITTSPSRRELSGSLKSILAQEIGVNPDTLKLAFRDEVKEDGEILQTAGVVNNSEVILMEDSPSYQESPEQTQESSGISKGCEAVAEVRKEVDSFSQQVSSLQVLVDAGSHVDDKKIIYLSEMLMRQLLKLDGIEAEGEGRVQRRAEVRRIQNLLETLDILKSKNSNLSNTTSKSTSTTAHETCNSRNVRSLSIPKDTTTETKSETHKPVNSQLDTKHGHESSETTYPIASSSPSQMPSYPHHTYPQYTTTNDDVTHYVPSNGPPHYSPYAVPHYAPSTEHYYAPSSHVQPYYHYVGPSSFSHLGVPYYVASPMPFSDTSPAPMVNPFMLPSSASPESCYVPSGSFPMLSSTKVTQNWEHFG